MSTKIESILRSAEQLRERKQAIERDLFSLERKLFFEATPFVFEFEAGRMIMRCGETRAVVSSDDAKRLAQHITTLYAEEGSA